MAVLTLDPPGPVDRPLLTESLEGLLQRGHVHLTGRQHSQELRLPLGLIPRQLELTLPRTVSQQTKEFCPLWWQRTETPKSQCHLTSVRNHIQFKGDGVKLIS